MTSLDLPLSGTVVLDLGQIYQGPYAGFLAAQAGAEVIKIEPRHGEPLRRRTKGGGASVPLAMLNANKRGITLDLKHRVNGGAKLVHPGGAKLVHLMLCGTRCWGVVPVVHRRDPRCFV